MLTQFGMDKKEIMDLGNAIKTLQREAVRQTLLIWKPEAERIINIDFHGKQLPVNHI